MRPLKAAFLLALLCSFWAIGHPLWEVDDARYAEVPREMVESGDWATPRLNYLDYVEKPPLWYWLCAASYSLFGVGEASARLPLALLSAAGVLGAAWLGSWLFAPTVGLLGGLILATSALYFFLARYITPDMGLTAALSWTLALTLRAALRPADARWAAPLAWACMGLSFLAKGLVGVVFPLGWAAGTALFWPEFRAGLKRLASPLGLALFLMIAAPWPWLMEDRHPGFLRVFFLEQHFQRFLTQKYNRPGGWYFYLLVLPAAFLPWTWFAWTGIKKAWAGRKAGDGRALSLAWWCAMVVVFFSVSSSKLATYILPAFPPLALLAATALADRAALARRLGLGFLAAWAAVFAASPWLSERLSARGLAREISSRYREGDRIYTYGTYLHGLPFYTGRRVDKTVNWVGELHYAKRDPATADRFGDDDDIRELPLKGRRVFVVLRARERDYFPTLAPGRIAALLPFGPWILAVFDPA